MNIQKSTVVRQLQQLLLLIALETTEYTIVNRIPARIQNSNLLLLLVLLSLLLLLMIKRLGF